MNNRKMDMLKQIRKVFVFLLISIFSIASYAQTQAELEMAKRIARQYGYSDDQINSMMNLYMGGGQNGKNIQTKTGNSGTVVDRNTEIIQDNQMQLLNSMQSVYGVSGQPGMQSLLGMDGILMQNGLFQNGLLGKKMYDPSPIFGHDVFRNTNLNFIPSYNIPTPDNYRLSAGDEVVIDVWGATVTNITVQLSPDGSIVIPDLGPVYLGGQTIKQAEKNVREYLSKIYSGIGDPTPNTFVKLSLGKIRSLTVNVLGEVTTPGSYTLPSLSTIASALYLAEGPSDIGSVRDIKLYRNGKLAGTFDVYSFMLEGKFDANIRLEDNDLIVVDPYINIVTVSGKAKRPMQYEMREGETLADIMTYCGGFAEGAYTGAVHVTRSKGVMAQAFDVAEENWNSFRMEDGDVVEIASNSNRFKNRVQIGGAVWRPGSYALSDSLRVLKDLIADAGGLRDDAYLKKGYIVRWGENREKRQVSFDLQRVILGQDRIVLQPDDSVRIFSVDSLMPRQEVSIGGEVNGPNRFEYREGMTLGDLILMAKGPTDAATLSKIELARRITATEPEDFRRMSDTIAVVMKFDLLKNPEHSDFQLSPFDAVYVFRSALYKPQQSITVEGEVNYPGTYVLEKNAVRLSDVIKKAEGFNPDAYVTGAKLTRMLTKEEIERLRIAVQIAKKQASDTSAVDDAEVGDRFYIGIDLAAAMANPGSEVDVVLRDGDIISVPKFNNTVKISGAVFYPNVVTFNPKFKYKRYISNAGGTVQGALKRKVYMVHMNGTVAQKGSKDFRVMPGTEIIVPMRDWDNKRRGVTFAEIMGVATSTASVAAMVVSISNSIK